MKQWKRLAALALTLCLALGLSLQAGAANETVEHAYALNDLGLFLGTDSGFELDKRPTRVEGMTMFVRLLGGEEEALNSNYAHPFTDVPKWGDPYVGYAWEHGLTKGTGKTTFGSTTYITLEEYVTFVLRALGYDDSQGDFTWKTSVDKGVEIGLLTREQADRFLGETTSRGTMVDVSFAALTQTFKGLERTLAEKLVDDGVFTRELAIQKGIWTAETPVASASPKPSDSPRPTNTPRPTESTRPTPPPGPTPSPKPTEKPSEILYGMVTSYKGIRHNSAGKDLQVYTVTVGRNKDVDVALDQRENSQKLPNGTLVKFDERADGEYILGRTIEKLWSASGAATSLKDGTTARAAAIRSYNSDKNLLTYWAATSRADVDSDFSVEALNTAGTDTVSKDVKIVYVNSDDKKAGDEIGVAPFDATKGYANAMLHFDKDNIIDVIIIETSGKGNLDDAACANKATAAFGGTSQMTMGDTLYGIVTGFVGTYHIDGKDFWRYTVAVGRDEDIKVNVLQNSGSLSKGQLVTLNEHSDMKYTLGEDIFVIVTDDDTVSTPKNGRFELAAIREYREGGRLLTYYSNTTRSDVEGFFTGNSSSITVDKDVVIVNINARDAKGDSINCVTLFNETNGYANAVLHINEDGIADAIICDTTGDANLAKATDWRYDAKTAQFGTTEGES